MTKLLVVHGAGMNMRGKAQLNLFGPMTLADYDREIGRYATELGVSVQFFHSNIEGEVVNALYGAHDGDVDAAVINPAGYMTGAPALANAISQVRFPTIEVHISNPAARGITSVVGPACKGVVTGFGIFGYYLAMKGVQELLKQAQAHK